MADIGLKAGTHLLEGFFLVAEEGPCRALAVLLAVGDVEIGILEPGIVENDQLGVLGLGGGGKSDERRRAKKVGEFHGPCSPVSQSSGG